MKTFLSLTIALGLPALALAGDQSATPAQPGDPNALAVTDVAGQPTKMEAPDRFIMSSGSVAAVRRTHTERLTNDVKLLDGTIVTPGGTVRRQDGSEVHLSDGQSISMDGKLSPARSAAAAAVANPAPGQSGSANNPK